MNDRDPAQYNEASETPDMGELDSPAEVLAEEMQQRIPWKKLTSKQEFCLAAATVAIQSVGPGQEMPAKPKEVLKRVLCEIIDATTPHEAQMLAKCYDIAFGLGIQDGASQTQVAEYFGVNKATVSRHCRLIVRRFSAFGIKPGPGMKSEAAVQVYAERERAKERKPKAPWSFRGKLATAKAV